MEAGIEGGYKKPSSRAKSDVAEGTSNLWGSDGSKPHKLDYSHVYIMASDSETLYVGVTNDILRRVYEHKTHSVPGFTKRYNCTKLVYYERSSSIVSAIEREKQLKRWRRSKKVAFIEEKNPNLNDLSKDWYE